MDTSPSRPTLIAVNLLKPNPWNRKYFNPDGLIELTASVKARGVHDPLIVRPVPTASLKPGDPTHEIVSGHRRWLAAQGAGLKEVPCWIQPLEDKEVREKNLLLNWAREGLPVIDQSRTLLRIKDEDKLNQKELAEQEGIPKSTVSNLLGFLDLPPVLLDSPVASTLSYKNWQKLKKIKDPAALATVCAELAGKNLQVKDLNKRIWSLIHEKGGVKIPEESGLNAANDPQALIWPALRDKVDSTCKETWAVVYTSFTFTGSELPGWAFGIINKDNVNPRRLSDWLKQLAQGIDDLIGNASPAPEGEKSNPPARKPQLKPAPYLPETDSHDQELKPPSGKNTLVTPASSMPGPSGFDVNAPGSRPADRRDDEKGSEADSKPEPVEPPLPKYVNIPDRVPTLEEVYDILRKRGEIP